jgi:hypothetical protein
MASDGRQRPRSLTGDRGEVGVTDPGRGHPDEHFPWAGRLQLHLFDLKGPAVGEGRRVPGRAQHRRADLHVDPGLSKAQRAHGPTQRRRERDTTRSPLTLWHSRGSWLRAWTRIA